MPQYSDDSDYNSVAIGFGPVQRRPIIRKNLDAFATSINKIDEAHREAIKQRGAIDVALSQIQLDHSEDEWKYNYVQKIKDTIDDAAMFGSYSTALTTATLMAAKAVSSPELMGRQRAYQDHKTWEDKLDARNDIEQITKMRFKEENPYHYEDKYDSFGNVVGGTKWTPNSEPVSDIKIEDLVEAAFKMVSPKQASVESQSSHGGTKDGVHSVSGGSSRSKYTRVDAIDIEDVANMMITDPSMAAAVRRRYDNYMWKYNDINKKLNDVNLTQDEKNKLLADKEVYWNEIKNEQGTYASDYRPWVKNRIKFYAGKKAYNWTERATSSHSDSTETGTGGRGSMSELEAATMLNELVSGTHLGPVLKENTAGYVANMFTVGKSTEDVLRAITTPINQK